MENPSWTALSFVVIDYLIRFGLSIRVIMRQKQVGATLAWLSILLAFPFAGAFIYLLFGELRLGSRRAERASSLHNAYQKRLRALRSIATVDWSGIGSACEPMAMLSETAGGIPAIAGNSWELLEDFVTVFDRLIADIDAAKSTCHLEFYIWGVEGVACDVAEALLRATERGVVCRVAVDAVGSHAFLRSETARRLRRGGVFVRAAMPVSLLRMLFVRFDLRVHRKIVVIDGEIAYTGSQNLVDPRFFKKDSHVGQWVDAMIRFRGPAVEALAATFLEDWELDTGEGLAENDSCGIIHRVAIEGTTVIQAIPSGPAAPEESIRGVLLQSIYSARRELVLTTPYFVPDEPLMLAIVSAALRGVQVTLIVPARVDSKLASLASEPHKGRLADSGVRILAFNGGLLHTKSVTVDGEFSLFGSLNLDPRSLMLNFEITLAVYDRGFTEALRALQERYIASSTRFDLHAWKARPISRRFLENVARLLSPLL